MDIKSAMHKFAEELLVAGIKHSQNTNIALSPCSVHSALSIALNGADGNTALEMCNALGFSTASLQEAVSQLRTTLEAFADISYRCNFKVVNALWHSRNITLLRDFVIAVAEMPLTKVASLDFRDNVSAAGVVNKWVQDKTENNIREIVTERDLAGDVAIVITNAVYFKEKWADPFDLNKTKPGPFKTGNGVVIAQFMHKTTMMHVYNGQGFRSVYLPYACGGDVCMQLILPNEGVSPSAIARQSITCAGIRRSKDQVCLALPKFKLAGPVVSLQPHLEDMGMRLAFQPIADFSRMTDGPLYISKVMHRVTVEVDEQGTEASAATAVAMLRCMPEEMKFDRPFIFVIWDAPHDIPLFAGVVNDPTQN